MGGDLWLDSEVGKGSTFHFTVRCEAVSAKPKRPTSLAQLNLKDRRLLFVDDNPTNLRILGNLAAKWGMPAEAAESGAAALEKAATSSFDFAILDMHMPEMDGITLARELRARLKDSCPSLILLSSWGIFPRRKPMACSTRCSPSLPDRARSLTRWSGSRAKTAPLQSNLPPPARPRRPMKVP